MTPKQKAVELIGKFKDYVAIDYKYDEEPIFQMQRQCALLAVEEIINYQSIVLESFPSDGYQPNYWNEVKQEIENI